MIQLAKILLPTDFSEFSVKARDYACEFAAQFNAELHVLHVLDIQESATPDFSMGLALPGRIKESRENAEQALQGFLDPEWAKDRSVVRATAEGPPFLEIIRYAKQENIDLIVMGTHGRSGLVHVLLGSVAERVVRKAPCPVLTVRLEAHQFVMP
jgi:nucleotide-binding universal stress UspA family protein